MKNYSLKVLSGSEYAGFERKTPKALFADPKTSPFDLKNEIGTFRLLFQATSKGNRK